MKYCNVPLILVCALMLLSCTRKQVPPPNVLIILADDLGWNDLACYGSSFYETPNLNALAGMAVKFNQAYAACPVCSPTRASIMTGKYPVRTGVTDYIGASQPDQVKNNWIGTRPLLPAPYSENLALEEYTIAEAFRDRGYRTGHFGKWHLGDIGYYPEDQGFDVNVGGWKRGSPYYNTYYPELDRFIGPNGYFSPYKNPKLTDGPEGEYLTDRITTEALRFIDEDSEKPFFLYLAYFTVHAPTVAKDENTAKFVRKADSLGLSSEYPFTREPHWLDTLGVNYWRPRVIQSNPVYAGMVYCLDENVGRILKHLKKTGQFDNTVIVFTSDNGGLSTTEGSPTSNLPLRRGKGWLYEGGIREPMIIKPAGWKERKETDFPVMSTDLMPTVLDLAGLDANGLPEMDGISLKKLIEEGHQPAREELYWHYPHYGNQGGTPSSAIRSGRYKLIRFYEDDHQELYDLLNDPGEHQDLSDSLLEQVGRMGSRLDTWLQETGALLPEKKFN